jgi:hypothetical protein
MTAKIEQAMEGVYTSINNNNEDIDNCIRALKEALAEEGRKEAVFKPERLAQNNRQGRKMMQTYFKKRGVVVAFEKTQES